MLASSMPICRSASGESSPPGTHACTFATTRTTRLSLLPPAAPPWWCQGQNPQTRTRAHLPTDPTTCPSHHTSQRPFTDSHTTACGLPGGGCRPKRSQPTPPPARLARPWPALAAPRSSPLFAPRPQSTWVSRPTARQVVNSNCRRAVTPASCRGAACLMEGFASGRELFRWEARVSSYQKHRDADAVGTLTSVPRASAKL
jgi:hypothetical protein